MAGKNDPYKLRKSGSDAENDRLDRVRGLGLGFEHLGE